VSRVLVDDEPLRAVCEKKAFQCTRDPSAETRPDPYLGLGFVCHPEEVVVVDAELTKGLITETVFVIRGLQSDGLVGLTSTAPNLTGPSPTPILPLGCDFHHAAL
jgi:hypothetical protein